MKQTIIFCLLVFLFTSGCKKVSRSIMSEETANAVVHKNMGLNTNVIPPEDDKNKDEFGCVVKNGEPPMTKCEESTGNTCAKLHTCESVARMRESGLYTEKELKQSSEIGQMFKEVYNADN